VKTAWILLVAGCGFQSPAATNGTGGGEGTPAAPDAGFDYASCPANYNVTALPGPSRYRLIASGHRAWEQSDDCNNDAPAATHLVVIETPDELAAVRAFASNPGVGLAGSGLYLGGVQLKTATTPSDAWLGFNGAPLINGWGGGEPNDSGGDESNHQEQFVMMAQASGFFVDVGGNETFGALCECDGKPIDPNVANVVAGYH
jgi:hypothetical protein